MKKLKTLKSKLVVGSVLILAISIAVNLVIGIGLSYIGMENNVERDLKSVQPIVA